jgi:class 3 adenylate cyclase/tetratricopeptide (TPR) repeat protein
MHGSNHCPRCDTDNRDGRRFCASCGGALPLGCPHCGSLNEPDDRFCGGCGRELEQPKSAGGLATNAGPIVLQSERRQVTILFADLSGYTALTAQRDPEETHGILQRFFEVVDTVVTKFGGVIERHIGDNVMGVFGAPMAHGDDPYRAVRAACDIHRAIASMSEEAGGGFFVHVGIASGTVMASSTGSTLKAAYAVVGSPVNLAARLQGTAAPGETLVSNAVRESTEELIDFDALGAVELKGFTAPIPVWRVRAERRERSMDRSVPLVGRRAEIKLLISTLADLMETGHGKVIYVRGEAGIGKTRLMQTIGHLAGEQGFSCHTALVLDFGAGQARDATRTLIASLLSLGPTSSEQDRIEAASNAVGEALVPAADRMFLNDLLDVAQAPDLRTLYGAMDDAVRARGRQRVTVEVIRSLSTKRPLVLIVEDLHWADSATLDTLGAIAEVAAECRVVLAMTSRVEGDPLDDAWRGRVRRGFTAIDLGPLRPEEASEFGERLKFANAQLLQRCIDKADGNPLFLEQLLRNTEESAESDEIPASIQSLVLSRMDRLLPSDKAALQAAAVAGQRFSLEFVRALLHDPGYVPTSLLRHQMIRPEGEEFLFSHALVRDGVYSSLTHERRHALHQASAEFYAGTDPILCAEHLARAQDPGAATAFMRAAVSEASEYRFDTALALAEKGRALAAEGAERFDLDALRGEFLREIGRAGESLAAWEAAIAEATNTPERCRALIGIAAANRVLSRYEPALSALAEAQPLADTADLIIERAQIHYYRGNIRFAQGDSANCLAEHQAALSAAEVAGSPEWRARASSGVGDALYSSCRMQAALDAFRSCVEICDTHGFARVALPNRIMMAHCMIYLQRLDEALPIIANARTLASLLGNPHAEMFSVQSFITAVVDGGRSARAADYFDAAISRVRALGARRYESNVLVKQAEYLLSQGEQGRALRLALDSVAISREVGMGFTGAYALAVLAKATRDPSVRAASLAEGEQVLARGSVGHNRIWYYRVAAEVHIGDRNWDEAVRCVDRLEQVTADEPLALVGFLAARVRALCRVGRGERGGDLEELVDRLIAEGNAKGHEDWLVALHRAKESFTPASSR